MGAPFHSRRESTAVLAYSLADSPIWDQEYRRFFDPLKFGRGDDAQLYASVPHRPGRIPVVFVHGTASSFGRWAEMYNRLSADLRLRNRYEFWFFSYNSGAPVSWSAMLLRDALRRAVDIVDPGGTDPAAADGRDRPQSGGAAHQDDGDRQRLPVLGSVLPEAPRGARSVSGDPGAVWRWAFVTPLPFVKRVIFVATPHRGSQLTVGRLAEWVEASSRLRSRWPVS